MPTQPVKALSGTKRWYSVALRTSRPFKHPKTGTYYFRRAVPLALRAAIGKREWKETLGTKDAQTARMLHTAVAARYDAIYWQAVNGAPPPALATKTRPIEPPSSTPPTTSLAQQQSTSFGQLLSGWALERQPKAKTIYDWTRFTDQLQSFTGHTQPECIDEKDIVRWKAKLLEQGLHPKTINTRLTAISGLFNWAVTNKLLSTNPAKGVKVLRKKRASAARLPFEEAQARQIVRQALNDSRPEIKWPTLIQAYTGDRVSSTAQLRKQDVHHHKDFYFLDLNDENVDPDTDEIRSQKTVSSVRRVPLHPAIIAAGFIDWVNTQDHGPLFSMVKPDRFGVRGANLGKRWRRWLRDEVGITDSRLVNHSWRHFFKDQCREHGIPEDVSHRLSGHSMSDEGSKYGAGYSLQKLYNYIQRLPDLTLQPIYPVRE